MQDDRGNLIDGSTRARERARPWLGARPKPQSEEESAESRSEAPKSIAASLLVPADMVSGAAPPARAGDSRSDAGEVPPQIAPERGEDPQDDHGNLFLAPDAAVTAKEASARYPKRRWIHLALERLVIAAGGVVDSLGSGLRALICNHRWPALAHPHGRPAAALGAIGCGVLLLITGVAIALSSITSPRHSPQQDGHIALAAIGHDTRLPTSAYASRRQAKTESRPRHTHHLASPKAGAPAATAANNNSGASSATTNPTTTTRNSSDTGSSVPASASSTPITPSSYTSSSAPASSVQSTSPPPRYSSPQRAAPAPQPPHASPSGALTCISNCG